jgi:hypothetical protein
LLPPLTFKYNITTDLTELCKKKIYIYINEKTNKVCMNAVYACVHTYIFTVIHDLLCHKILDNILISQHFTEVDNSVTKIFCVTCVWVINTLGIYYAESRCKYLY